MNLNLILERYNLDENNVAQMLFPDNKRPNSALKRVKDNEALLNSEQFAKLAAYIGVPMEALMQKGWTSAPATEDTLILTSGEYEVILNKRSFETRIFHKNSLFYGGILVNRSTTLSEYIDAIEEAIKNR